MRYTALQFGCALIIAATSFACQWGVESGSASNEQRQSTLAPSPTPTSTPVASATPTPTPTPRPSATPTPTPTPSSTPTPTPPPAGNGECFDGIDNNHDGHTDFDDFGCFGPNAQETNTNYGFTLFHPSVDTHIIYVSTSGLDSNTGADAAHPIKTIAHGTDLLRQNYNGTPAWLLLKRGDTWNEAVFWGNLSGRSAAEPMLLGSYGASSVRPLVKTEPADRGLTICCDASQHFAIVGIHFYSYKRDPHSPDFDPNAAYQYPGGIWEDTSSQGGDILVEDCLIEFYAGDVFQQDNTSAHITGLTWRRNTVYGNYGRTQDGSYHDSRSQGIWSYRVDQMLLEDNLFDHNGWNENVAGGESNIYSHNIYLDQDNSHVTVRKNIIARASSHGLQLRPGGDVEDNLFLRNAITMFTASVPSIVSNNVVLDSARIQAGPAAGARGWGISIYDLPSATVSGNIVAHKPNLNGEGNDFAYELNSGAHNVTLQENIDYAWDGPSINIASGATYTFVNNHFQDTSPGIHFRDPNRSIVTYYNNILHPGANLSEAAALEAFLSEARAARGKFNWDARYTSDSVNAYIRQGFEILP